MAIFVGRDEVAARIQKEIGDGALQRALMVSGASSILAPDLQYNVAIALSVAARGLGAASVHHRLLDFFLFRWSRLEGTDGKDDSVDADIGAGPLKFALGMGTTMCRAENADARIAPGFAESFRRQATVLAERAEDDAIAAAIEAFLFRSAEDCLRVDLDAAVVDRLIAASS